VRRSGERAAADVCARAEAQIGTMPTAPSRRPRPRILIAGGGVGAVEGALALRDLLDGAVRIDLVAPQDDVVYRPQAVAEPFGYAAARRLPLEQLERTHDVHHVRNVIEAVDPVHRRVRLARDEWMDFDALLVATGALQRRWLDDALTFGGEADIDAYRALLEEVRAGRVQRLLFAVPPGRSWPLPLYELALLTAAWSADQGVTGLEMTLVTPEPEPLLAFGPAAARALRDLLGDRGIRLHVGRQVVAIAGDRVRLDHGDPLAADRVVTLPELVGAPPAGLPADADGFLRTGPSGGVEGAPGVWAVGDATAGPVKMGGLATAQADAAAVAIAHALGASVRVDLPAPELRGILLTGVAAAYLRARLDGTEDSVAFNPLWSPPTKIAGRYLAPYLAGEAAVIATPVLADRAPVPSDRALADREDIRALALDLAKDDAAHGEYRSALHWLQTVEWLDGGLQADLAALRASWEDAAGH
jgi:sulfide:quinone oxidoreductase